MQIMQTNNTVNNKKTPVQE